MHKKIKSLIITGVITVNTVFPTIEVLANEIDEEVSNTNVQNYDDKNEIDTETDKEEDTETDKEEDTEKETEEETEEETKIDTEVNTIESEGIEKEDTEKETEEEKKEENNNKSTQKVKKISIQPNKGSFDWGYSTTNEVAIQIEFDNTTDSKIVEIELEEGMVFDRYTVLEPASNSVEIEATPSEKAVIKSVLEKPVKDKVTGLYSGKLIYELNEGVASGKIVINVSVDRYRYYEPKEIQDSIKVIVKENGVESETVSINTSATDHRTIGAKNNSLKSTATGRTEEIQPGGIGTTYSYYRNTTSTVQSDDAGIRDFTLIKNAELTMYYPEGTILKEINKLPDDATYKDYPSEHKVVISMPNETIKNSNISLSYEVKQDQPFGTTNAPNKNTLKVEYYDGKTKTLMADVQDSVEVIDPNTLSENVEMTVIDGYYHDYDGNSLSIGGFIYLQNKAISEYTDQVFEYKFKDWNTRKVLLPDSMTDITNIKYKIFGDETEYSVDANDLVIYEGAKRLIDADSLQLLEGKYFEWVSFEVPKIPVGFDDSTNGRSNKLAISLGELPKGIDQGSTTVKIYKKGQKDKANTITQPIKRVKKPEKIAMSSGNTTLKNDLGDDITVSYTQNVLTANTMFDANKGFNRIYNTSNYMENPEIILRMPKGFYLSTGTIKLTQKDIEKTFTIDKREVAADGSTIYTLQTNDVKIGGFDPKTLEIYPGLNVNFEFITDTSVDGSYNLNDMIFIGKKGAHLDEIYANSGFLVPTDVNNDFDLIQGEQIDGNLRTLGRTSTKEFEIKKVSDLVVTTHVREHGSDIEKPPYNVDDESTAIQVSKGTFIDYIVRIENNYNQPAEDFYLYIPIPKKGVNMGPEVQTGKFTWDMELVNNVEFNVVDADGNTVDITTLFELKYGKSGLDSSTYSTTYDPDIHDVIEVLAKKNIDPGIVGEIKCTLKASDSVLQSDIGEINVLNAYYRRRYDNGATDIRLKGNSVGLRLAIGQIKGLAFLDKDRDGIYTNGTDEVLKDVNIELWNKETDTKVAATNTDSNGMYLFEGLANGEYEVRVINNDGSLDINISGAKRFTKQTAIIGDSYKKDSDFESTDNVNGSISVSVPTKSYIHDINDFINVGFIEPVNINVITDGNGTLSGLNSGQYKAWPFTATVKPETVTPNPGYKFVNYTDTEGNVFNFGNEITSDLTIVANFKKETYKLTFDPNGGKSGDVLEKSVTFDELLNSQLDSLTESDLPSREGHKFIGWSKNEEGTDLVTDTDKMPASEMTLYAVWDEAPVISILNKVVTIKAGTTIELMNGVTITDKEDANIEDSLKYGGDLLDINTPGKYTITYTVTDSAGNTVTESREIVVLTNEAPKVTGATNITLKPSQINGFDPTEDLEMSDDHDSKDDLAINVTIKDTNTGNVVTDIEKPEVDKENKYELVIEVTDKDGNTTTVKREVTVTNNAPKINGLSDITIKKGQTVSLLEGVTATDDEDEEINIEEIEIEDIDLSKLDVGTYTIEYSVTDKDGNKTTELRTVKVLTNEAPEVTGGGDITLKPSQAFGFDPIEDLEITDDHDSKEDLEINVTITDVQTGDVIENIETPEVNKENKYEIVIEVTDKDGNTTTVKRVVTLINNAPKISGLSDITIKKGQTVDLTKDVTANDVEDGKITDKIVFPNVNLGELEVGTHTVEYSVTDEDENITTELRKITVLTNEAPEVTVGGDKTLKPSQINGFDPTEDLEITDDHDSKEDLEINVTIKDTNTGNIVTNIEKPEVNQENKYEIVIEVTDKDGNTTTVERVVKVTNNAPKISGLSEITIKKGQTVDLTEDVIATDVEDGEISIDEIEIQDIDLSTLDAGTYTIEYSVTDKDGNKITELRKITVLTNEAPEVTGGGDKTLKPSEINGFDPTEDLEITDDHDSKEDLTINVTITDINTGNVVTDIEKPEVNKENEYKVVIEVTDKDGNTTTVERVVKVTNNAPKISGLSDITIRKGQTVDLRKDVTATDDEDGEISIDEIEIQDIDLSTLDAGTYTIEYSVTDKDENKTTELRKVTVLTNGAPIVTGGGDITLKPSQTDGFNPTEDLEIEDDHDSKEDLTINVTITDINTGNVVTDIEKPEVNKENEYKVVIEVTDKDGNTTTVERVVKVTNNAPKISGLSEITIKKGQTVDLTEDVIATDVEDGEISIDEIEIQDIDLSTLDAGTYTIEYSVTDKDGNKTTELRKIIVLTNEAPEVTGGGDKTLKPSEINGFNPTGDLEITDDHDSKEDLEINVTITDVQTGEVVTNIEKPEVNQENKYEIVIEVTDKDGNTTTVERVVKVTNNAPKISGLSDITIKKDQTVDLTADVTANDVEDGEITDSIVFPNIDLSKLEVGTHTIEYSVIDEDGNKTTELRKVTVLTNETPEVTGGDDITLKPSQINGFNPTGDLEITDDHDSKEDLEINVTITDVQTGEVVTNIEKPEVNQENKYEIVIEVTDKDGNTTTVERVVTVTNNAPTISGLSDITIKKGQTVDLTADVTANDVEDGEITDSIVFPNIDLSKLEVGTHTIEYSVTDEDGNTVTESIQVIILANEAPTIIVDDKIIEVGTKFDPLEGVIATDSEGVDITDKINVLENTVDTSTEGTYVVKYEVTDSYGETTVKSIMVTVVSKDKPTTPDTKPVEPEVDSPEADSPNENLPEVDLPEADSPNENLPEVDSPEADSPNENLPEVDSPEADSPNENLPEIDSPDEDITIEDTTDQNINENPQTGDKSLMGNIALLASSIGVLFMRRKKDKK